MLKVVFPLVRAWPPRVKRNNRFSTTKGTVRLSQIIGHGLEGPGASPPSTDQKVSKAVTDP